MEKKTLHVLMHQNVGQMSLEDAEKNIKRLNKQFPGTNWRTDDSNFLFVEDETDDEMINPTPLTPGNVWVVSI